MYITSVSRYTVKHAIWCFILKYHSWKLLIIFLSYTSFLIYMYMFMDFVAGYSRRCQKTDRDHDKSTQRHEFQS